MLTKDRQANIFSISVGSHTRSYTVPIVEKFVERVKAHREPTQGYRPYRTAKIAYSGCYVLIPINSDRILFTTMIRRPAGPIIK